MKEIALLVVDVQRALLRENPYDCAEFMNRVELLIETARARDVEVIYVRHDGGLGDPLAKGTEGFEIAESIFPRPGEKVFDKRFPSAFRETGLKEYLDSRAINQLMIVGMQTEYCIDATTKAAFERGYRAIIPAGATTTFDNKILRGVQIVRFYENYIWNHSVADVVPFTDAVELLSGQAK